MLYSCGDIFGEKYGEKKNRTNTEKKNRRRIILSPTIQLAINLYTKYEVSILNGLRDVFDENSQY